MPRAPDSTQHPAGARPAPQPAYAAYAGPGSAQFSTQYGLNPVANAAALLIAVFSKTRQTVSHPNVGGLYQQVVAGIRKFEEAAKEKNVAPESVLAARYILCAALDEAVLNTPWGAESGWAQRTLLSTFHSETHGGEKFFLLLDKMKERPAQNLDLLELMYILLSLGFEGKYHLTARGRDALDKIRDEVFQVIRTYRGEYERTLSPRWQGLGKTRNSLAHYVPMWVVASVLAGVLVLTYSGFRYWLYHSTAHVAQQLDDIAVNGVARKSPNK
jgi:type VI secretion system protein ImpK